VTCGGGVWCQFTIERNIEVDYTGIGIKFAGQNQDGFPGRTKFFAEMREDEILWYGTIEPLIIDERKADLFLGWNER
jgi:hypothetical protein